MKGFRIYKKMPFRIRLLLVPALLLIVVSGCDKKQTLSDNASTFTGDMLPRALFITSGTGDGRGTIAQGVVLAIQELNKYGIPVRLESREILDRKKELGKYNILILSTAIQYHDADRQYSLTYMSDTELENIRDFVSQGGVLIAGDNVGRNYLDGTDRITVFGKLDADNWPLTACLGVTLEERNLQGYALIPAIAEFENAFQDATIVQETWALVAGRETDTGVQILAWWAGQKDSFPAFTHKHYGKGASYLLPSSYYLHPANDGGYWSAIRISEFYDSVVQDYFNDNLMEVRLNPWPDGYRYAFDLSFNAEGNAEEFDRILSFLDENELKATWFVNGRMQPDLMQELIESGQPLASNGFEKKDLSGSSWQQAVQQLLFNEQKWSRSFTGFRFPYTRPGFWGLVALKEYGYLYESGLGADNLKSFTSPVIPYNIPVSSGDYYRCSEILEISPTYYDDYNFIGSLASDETKDPKTKNDQLRLYLQYLLNYWNNAVKPYNGQMTFLGHPAYTGFNDTTLNVLQCLIDSVNTGDTWMATLDEIARFRKSLTAFSYYVKKKSGEVEIRITGPDHITIPNLSFVLQNKPRTIKTRFGKPKLINRDEDFIIICQGKNAQVVNIGMK